VQLLLNSLTKLLFIGLSGLVFLSQPALALEKVTLQLKWSHAYQFAGYYVAKELGYYQAAGLEVDIRPLQPNIDVVQEVVTGRANYGTGTSGLLVARQNGAPVLVLAAIYQHSPYVLIAKKFKENQSIQDLNNKPILLRPLSDELLVYLKHQNINLTGLSATSPRMDTIEQLVSGKVAAISGYVSNEPYRLLEKGFPYQIYNPRSIGIDIYGDNLFTTNAEQDKFPERTERFRIASLQGWEYALKHPAETLEIIQKYAPGESAKKIQFEAEQINPLIKEDLVPVGYMNLARWEHTVNIYKEAGTLSPNFTIDGFVYEPNPKKDLTVLYGALLLAIIALFLVGSVVYYIWRLNQRLRHSLLQAQHLADHDVLTGLPNRALFVDRLQRAILKARREKSLFALLYIDIDRFKQINDQYGHAAGDEVLKACCNRMMASIRDSDSLGRLGGDEFVALLEDLRDPGDALEIAKKFQAAVSMGVSSGGVHIATTVSIGIAVFPLDSDSEEGLFKRADSAMYRSKQNGRNSIYLYSESSNNNQA
jgi:diguanylate cyclase (GGDEF)-like protein